MEGSEVGLVIKAGHGKTVVRYEVVVGRKGEAKLFLSSPEIRKAIKAAQLKINDPVGWTNIWKVGPNPEIIELKHHFPLGSKLARKFKFFEKKGIASKIESSILGDLKRKFPSVKKIKYTNPTPDYRATLRKRGLPHEGYFIVHDFDLARRKLAEKIKKRRPK